MATRTENANGALVEQRIAHRLAALRAERGWSLDQLANQIGISRATLSRTERGELSPTAAMLGKLCAAYGWTMSRLIATAESKPPSLIRPAAQTAWVDPETRYRRRAVSPPAPGLRAEMVEVRLPAGAAVSFEASPVPDLEHHLWMLQGSLQLTVDGNRFRLSPGDCLRYVLTGPSHFECKGKRPARYILTIVRP